MKLEPVKNHTEIRKLDVLVILDDAGKIRGVDRVASINRQSGRYKYHPVKSVSSVYTGDIKEYLGKWQVFILTDYSAFVFYENYNDKALLSAWSGLENVFEDAFGDIGSSLSNLLWQKSKSNIRARIAVVDFEKKNRSLLSEFRFEGKGADLAGKKLTKLAESIVDIEWPPFRAEV